MAELIDKFTDMDEILREILIAVRGQDIASKGMGTSSLISLAKEKQHRELRIVFFTYPYDGTQVALSAGSTEIDFEAGTVKDTSGTVTNLQHSLRSEGKDFLRSLYINTDKSIKVQLDSGDIIFCDEEKDLQATYMEFTKVKITTTETTYLSLLACTNPEAILTLVDKASQVSGGSRLIYADKVVEEAGKAAATFKTDQVLGTNKATLYLDVYPATTQKFEIDSIRFCLNPDNGSAYQLYLLEHDSDPGGAILDIELQKSEVVYDSGSGMADSTHYIEVNGGVLPMEVNLGDTAKLYYMIDWVTAPTDVKGFITIRGTKLS